MSVVIATHDRAHLLPPLLRAIDAQEGVGPFDIIVVDDASSDTTPHVLAELKGQLDRPLTTLRLDRNSGPGAARNAGWRSTLAPTVVFTDDDCVPQPGWLAGLTRAIDGGADIAQGYTRPDQEAWERRGQFSHILWVQSERGFYETCNIAYRRDVIEGVGGFDETFRYRSGRPRPRPVFGEDTDLAWRAIEAGATTAWVPEALVHHAVWPSSYSEHLRAKQRREGVAVLMRRHPQLRSRLHRRVFLEPTHPWALVALASIGAAGRPRARWLVRFVTLLACVPYVVVLLRERPFSNARKRLLYLVPMELAAELFEISVCAAASVRHRSVVL